VERLRWLMFFHFLNGSQSRLLRSLVFLMPIALGLVGLWFQSPLVAGLGLLWVIFELRIQFARPRHFDARGGLQWLPHMLARWQSSSPDRERDIRLKISAALELADGPKERRWLTQLDELVALRSLVFDGDFAGKRFLEKAIAGSRVLEANLEPELLIHPSADDVMLAATKVVRLYTHLLETGESESEPLRKFARSLFQSIFATPYTKEKAQEKILPLVDQIQREGGIPFLVLSWVQLGNWDRARAMGRDLLTREVELDEELRSTLYWLAELGWFKEHGDNVEGNFESTIRYLYHLCLTNPEKAGFLEIDSRFYSQFENVNELAREGMLFKDTLVEKILALWHSFPGQFDRHLTGVLETITGTRSKAIRDIGTWSDFWAREKENFGQALLLTIEGNLSFSHKDYAEARRFYEKALLLDTELRAARLNLVFALAYCRETELHRRAVESILSDKTLYPTNYFVAGDSHLLVGEEQAAGRYYEKLRQDKKVEARVDHHVSVLLFDAGEYERALPFARAAHKRYPEDSHIRYHLSVCYDRVGEKDHALDHVKELQRERSAEWLQFYRFTLERDSGRTEDASSTLKKISRDYFQDPDELEAALDFAKDTQDLSLLRHLRRYE